MSIINILRTPRLFGIALFDFISAFIGIIGLLYLHDSTREPHYYYAWATLLTLPIGVLSHIVSNTPTMLNYYLGLSERPT